jgi:CHAT domain-containing protein/tetratricopeptide (TPR) repeat protein
MRAPNPSPSTPECIGDAEWLEVAAGLLPEVKTSELMKHAAHCGHCGPLLKNAAEALVDEATPSEEALLASLESAGPEWRKNMATTLHQGVRDGQPTSSWWNLVFGWPAPAYALLGIVAVAAVAWIGMRALHPPSAEQLLARAYTEHRTLEVMIPGAKYGPIRVERGIAGSSIDKPPALLKAEALIGENLQKNPSDSAWLQAKARADLLDGNYDSAIKTLQRALEAHPDDPSLLADLGAAYYVRAENANRPVDYGNAIESLGKALNKTPDDPVALFNQALACEHMFLYTRAIDDWEHYLRVDPQGGWADEARKRLDAIKEQLQQHEKSQREPLLTPDEFIAVANSPNGKGALAIDQQIERYLDQAFHSWLPGMLEHDTSSGESRRALECLAEILERYHDDTWLKDLLSSPPSALRERAVRELADSDTALMTGRYGRGIDLAQQSERDFVRSKNQAGELRAEFSLMMAQAFSHKFDECLKTADQAHWLAEGKKYRWLQTQVWIEQGQCLENVPHPQEALRVTLNAFEAAKKFHYLGLELRATSFAAGYRSYTSGADQSFHELNDALRIFWQSHASNTRGQNLYTTLADIADETNQPYLDALALSEIVDRFPTNDPTDQAVRREIIAGAQERSGDYKAAQRSLKSAELDLIHVPDDEAVISQKAEIALEGAAIRLHLGSPQDAIAVLAGLREHFETSSAGLLKAEYFQAYAEAFIALGQNESAAPLLDRAIAIVETGLADLPREPDRLSWSRVQGQVYRDELEIKLRSRSPQEAFRWWEWYRGASLRPSTLRNSTLLESRTEDLSNYSINLPHEISVISFALLKNAIATFVLRDGQVVLTMQPRPSDLEQLSSRFFDNCSDGSSDLSLLGAEGRRIYDILLAPLESELQGTTVLEIETDGALDQIPFHLLQGKDGAYIGDKFEISFSQGIAYGARSRSLSAYEPLTSGSAALIVAAWGAANPSLPALAEASNESDDVASFFQGPVLVSGRQVDRKEVLRDLQDARIFHYAGHAVADANRVGLLLAPNAILSARDLMNWRPRNLRLAVLSACDTARGEEGKFTDISSLVRALVADGVPQVVASRWRVDSGVTRQLMRTFYSNLMSGKTTTASLQAASLSIRSHPNYQHPFYWASFSVFGTS